jgi:hypothetical protein
MPEDATFTGRIVRVDGRSWRVAYPIRDLRRVGDTIALIYDYTAGPRAATVPEPGRVDLEGRRLWTAQHPTNETADVYVNFLTGFSVFGKLVVYVAAQPVDTAFPRFTLTVGGGHGTADRPTAGISRPAAAPDVKMKSLRFKGSLLAR